MTTVPDAINYWHKWPSNFTEITSGQNVSVNGLGRFFQYINSDIGGYFGVSILIATFIISFLALKNYSGEKAFAASSFIVTVIAVLLMRINMVGLPLVIMLAAVTAVSAILVRNESQRGI